jgi:HEAT repeats
MTGTTAYVRPLASRRFSVSSRIVARQLAAFAVIVLGVLIALPPRLARADGGGRTSFLVGRLQADDFRVRTNAALALGQTGDDAAIAPLCGALADSSTVVRQAVAVALERLAKPASVGCLKDRLAAETSDAVKRQIAKALGAAQSSAAPDSSGSGSGASPARVVANAKFYVALSPIANQTGRPDDEIARVVGGSVRGKLDELGGFQVAPDKESPDQARAAIAKRKLKGYYLALRVEKFDYSDGNLRVRVKIAVFSYPGKDLRGEVPAGLTQTGVSPGDKAAEDNLLQMAAARAVDLFVQNFP